MGRVNNEGQNEPNLAAVVRAQLKPVISRLDSIESSLKRLSGQREKNREMLTPEIPISELERVTQALPKQDEIDSKYFSINGVNKTVVKALQQEARLGGTGDVNDIIADIFDSLPALIAKTRDPKTRLLDINEVLADQDLLNNNEMDSALERLILPDGVERIERSAQPSLEKILNSAVELVMKQFDESIAQPRPHALDNLNSVINNLLELDANYRSGKYKDEVSPHYKDLMGEGH